MTKTKGVFRITGPGHQGWSRNVDNELGNYDYLLGIDVSGQHILSSHLLMTCQIDHRHPAVQEDLLNWGAWILEVSAYSLWALGLSD